MKTRRSWFAQPPEYDVVQLRCYLRLFNTPRGILVEKHQVCHTSCVTCSGACNLLSLRPLVRFRTVNTRTERLSSSMMKTSGMPYTWGLLRQLWNCRCRGGGMPCSDVFLHCARSCALDDDSRRGKSDRTGCRSSCKRASLRRLTTEPQHGARLCGCLI